MRLGSLKLVGALLGVVLGLAFAAAPASAAQNDDRANAVGVVSGQNLPDEDNIDATLELQAGEWEGPCIPGNPDSFNYGATVWYEFSARNAGTLTVQTITRDSIFGGFFDSNLAVFRGASISTPPLECNDDQAGISGADSRVDVQVEAGRTYGIQVGGILYQDPDTGTLFADEGTFQLLVSFKAAPVVTARLAPQPLWSFGVGKHHDQTELIRLKVSTERHAKVVIRCAGDCKGIGHRAVRRQPRVNVGRMFGKNDVLDQGTKITIEVTKEGEIGRFFSYVMRGNGKSPTKRDCKIESGGRLTGCA